MSSLTMSGYKVVVLFNGYSKLEKEYQLANCSCTLIAGPKNIIVDTMTPWDGERLVAALQHYGLNADDIHYVVSTHGHSDHTGNNNLFLKAKHIVGWSISHKDKYFHHPFADGAVYNIDDFVSVIPTPGHTLSDVSVVVKSVDPVGVVVVAGDLFECEEDLKNDQLWKEAGSENEELQNINRQTIIQLADYIVPGHGEMFKVNKPVDI